MSTRPGQAEVVRSRKLGSENAVVLQLPADRFEGAIPSRHEPAKDAQGRYRVMLLAQDCRRCSFDDEEAGPVRELHLWLHLDSAAADPGPIAGADVMLPSQRWLALFVATDNAVVEANLRSFGFDPARLASVELGAGGGSVETYGGARVEWAVAGEGRGPATVGIHHALFVPGDGPEAVPHRIAALISDAVMGQPAELRVRGAGLEPFLGSGERWPALVHRMTALDADIVWRPRPAGS